MSKSLNYSENLVKESKAVNELIPNRRFERLTFSIRVENNNEIFWETSEIVLFWNAAIEVVEKRIEWLKNLEGLEKAKYEGSYVVMKRNIEQTFVYYP